MPENNSHDHAIELDKANSNTKRQDAIQAEIGQQIDCKTYKDLGHKTKTKPPADFKKIRAPFVYDAKHDGHHKARLSVEGRLTNVPLSSVYSGVVSLKGTRLVLFLAELNGLESWGTDAGNAYLEAKTKEKVCIIAGSAFGSLKDHILTTAKALRSLRTPGLRWHERLDNYLRDIGVRPCKMEPYIWMRKVDTVRFMPYEHAEVYADDLLIVSKSPQTTVDSLINQCKFKLKGTVPLSYHLGCDFARDVNNDLCLAPRKCI